MMYVNVKIVKKALTAHCTGMRKHLGMPFSDKRFINKMMLKKTISGRRMRFHNIRIIVMTKIKNTH